jgi:tetratricopeptide (TPR) repeat protein
LEPTHWQAHLQRGHCYLATQEWEKGRTDYEQARALQPENHDVALAFARYHLMRREEETARPYLEQVIQAQPAHWGANMMLGVLAERASDVPGAERAYLAALQAETNRAEPYARLGLLCCHQGRYQEACEHFQRMLQNADANPKSTPVEGQAVKPSFLKTAEELVAERHSERPTAARAHDDTLPLTDAVLFHWGYARAMCADYGGALEVWRQLQQRCPEDQHLTLNVLRLHYLLGRQHAEAEKCEEAILAWEEFLNSRPDDEDLRKDIAELYFRMALTGMASLAMCTESDFERVRADLNSVVQLNGSHPFAPFYLALCDLLDGPPARAAQALEALCAGEPSAFQLRVMYHWGIALLRSGQNGRARDILRAVANHALCAKLELPIYMALAVACSRTGQWEDALEALERLR